MIVRDVAELRRLTRARRGFVRAEEDVIRLEIAGVADGDRRRWEAQLNDHVGACGCDGGAVALAAVLGAYVILRGVLGMRVASGAAREFAGWTVLGTVLTAAGKAAGLYRSRRILTRVGQEVERAQAAHRAPAVVT